MSTSQDYVGLISGEFGELGYFPQVITQLTQGFVDDLNLKTNTPFLYDIDSAVGSQLDTIGKWVGIGRLLKIAITGVYFSLDSSDPALGWDVGAWQGPDDANSGLTNLNDADYRLLLKWRIAANGWDGTMSQAATIWNGVFAGVQQVIIQDYQDMSFAVGFVGPPLTSIQKAMLVQGYLPIKPSGVRIAFYALPVDTNPLFAWDVANTLMNGWDSASWFTTP